MSITITVSSEPIKDYRLAIDDADTLDKLRGVLTDWKLYAGDAYDAVMDWTEADFEAWRIALAGERKKVYMGDEAAARFGVVLLPEVLLVIESVAQRFQAPWMIARDRLLETKQLRRVSGRLVVVRPKS